jgi:alpha-mannosidase
VANDDSSYVTFEDGEEKFLLSTIQLSKDKDNLVVRFFSDGGALQKRLDSKDLRSRDPKTGNLLDRYDDSTKQENEDMVTVYRAGSSQHKNTEGISPDRVEKKAKVGYEVTWSDGAKFIYSRTAIAKASGGIL